MNPRSISLGGLGFDVPAEWRLEQQNEAADSAELIFVFPVLTTNTKLLRAKPTHEFLGSVLLEWGRREEEVELSRWVAERVGAFKRAQPSCRTLVETKSELAALPAVAREHLFQGPGRLLYQQRLVYTAFGKETLVASTTHLAGGPFEAARAALAALLATTALRTSGD